MQWLYLSVLTPEVSHMCFTIFLDCKHFWKKVFVGVSGVSTAPKNQFVGAGEAPPAPTKDFLIYSKYRFNL